MVSISIRRYFQVQNDSFQGVYIQKQNFANSTPPFQTKYCDLVLMGTAPKTCSECNLPKSANIFLAKNFSVFTQCINMYSYMALPDELFKVDD